jgi:hypothetical protein
MKNTHLIDTKLEERLQQEWYSEFHNRYPQYRGLLCYNLNNSANKIQGAKNKSMGLQPGRADMVFYFKSKAYHLEIKTPTGIQRENQKQWQKLIESQGFEYTIHRTKEDFFDRILTIIEA